MKRVFQDFVATWIVGVGTLLLMGSVTQAASYVVTAEATKINCSNGNQVIMAPMQVLQLEKELNRSVYRIRMPSKFLRRCPVGTVSSFSVYNLGAFDSGNQGSREMNPSKRKNRSLEPFPVFEENEDYNPYASKNVLRSSEAANAFFDKITDIDGMAPACRRKFLGKEGLGVWGEHVKDILSYAAFEETLESNRNAFTSVCPGYRGMSKEQKKNLVLITLMAKTNWESSCNPKAENDHCPKGICYGINQLHLGSEQEYVKTKQFRKYCPQYASRSPKASLTCTLAMFMESLWRGESMVGNTNSYWEVLAPQYENSKVKQFKALISQLPDCAVSTLARPTQKIKLTRQAQTELVEPRRRVRILPRVKESPTNLVPIGNI